MLLSQHHLDDGGREGGRSGPKTQPPPGMQLLLFLPNSEGALRSCGPPRSMVPDSDQRLAGPSFFPTYNYLPEKVAPGPGVEGCVARRLPLTQGPLTATERVLGKLIRRASGRSVCETQGLVLVTKRDLWHVGGCWPLQTFLQTETDQALRARTETWLPRWSHARTLQGNYRPVRQSGREPSRPAGRRRVVRRPQSSVGWE